MHVLWGIKHPVQRTTISNVQFKFGYSLSTYIEALNWNYDLTKIISRKITPVFCPGGLGDRRWLRSKSFNDPNSPDKPISSPKTKKKPNLIY